MRCGMHRRGSASARVADADEPARREGVNLSLAGPGIYTAAS